MDGESGAGGQERSRAPVRILYVGKTKDVLSLPQSHYLGFRFKDNILGRAGRPDNGGNEVVGQQPGKGRMACETACLAFEELRRAGIPTHFEERLSEDSVMVRKTDPIRLELISRNLAYGSYLRRHPETEPLADISGTREITLKDDLLDDPILSREEAVARGIITADELPAALGLLDRVTETLTGFFKSRRLRLADFKMEVGRLNQSLVVIDDLGYDNIRVFSGSRLLTIGELHAALSAQA